MKHEEFEKIRLGIESAEIDRLKQQIRYQDQRDGRIGTHGCYLFGPTCYLLGPAHYECALRKIEELESER